MALRQVLARQPRAGRATSPVQSITWESDGRCLLPRWQVDDSQATRRFRVFVEIEDLDAPGIWRTISSHEFEPNAPRKDGGVGMPSGIINFRVYDVATDLPREPRGCRISVEPVAGNVILGLSVEDRGVQRDPSEPLPLRHHSIALVQEIDEALGAESASNTLAFGSDITSGSAITVQQANYRNNSAAITIATPTDSRSNSYAPIEAQQNFTVGTQRAAVRGYYALNSSAGANTVTYTHDNGAGNASYTNAQQEWSGMATSSALDDTAAATGTGTALSAGDLAPTADNELLISYFSHFGSTLTTTEEGGWSMPTDLPDGASYMPLMVLYKIQASAATEDADLTLGSSADWVASAGSFKSVADSAAITGTATASITEADIVAGGKTIIETLSGTTFKPAAGTPAFSTAEAASTTTAPGRTGNGDLTITFPSGYTPTAGDFALIALWHDQGTGSLPSGGWAEVTGSPFGAGTEKLQLFWKVLAGGESAPVTTISGSGTNISHCAGMLIYTDVGSIGAIGTPSNGTGTPMTAAAINTTVNNAIVIAVAGRGDNEVSGSQTFGGSGTGVNERMDAGTGAGNDSQVSAADKSFATSGTSSGAFSSTTSATDPWVCVQLELKPSTPFADARQAIINGLDSAQSEANGWDAVVKAGLSVTDVVRTSDTVVTITLPAFASYNITAQETITATVPAAALTSGGPITGTPTFTIAAGAAPTVPAPTVVNVRVIAPTLSLNYTPAAEPVTVAVVAPTASLALTPAAEAVSVSVVGPSISLNLVSAATPVPVRIAAPSLALNITPAATAVGVVGVAPSVTLSLTSTPDPTVVQAQGVAPALSMAYTAGITVASVQVATPTRSLSVTPAPIIAAVQVVNPTQAVGSAPAPVVVLAVVVAPTLALALTPTPTGVNSNLQAVSIALALTPASTAVNVSVVAPSLTFVYQLTPAPTTVAVSVVNPSVSLALTPASEAVSVSVVAPGLSLALTPAAEPVTVAVVNPAVSLSITPTTVVVSVLIVAPSTGGAINIDLDPVVVDVRTVAPALALNATPAATATSVSIVSPSMALVLTPAAEAVSVNVVNPSVSLAFTLATVVVSVVVIAPDTDISGGAINVTPDPVVVQARVVAPALALAVTPNATVVTASVTTSASQLSVTPAPQTVTARVVAVSFALNLTPAAVALTARVVAPAAALTLGIVPTAVSVAANALTVSLALTIGPAVVSVRVVGPFNVNLPVVGVDVRVIAPSFLPSGYPTLIETITREPELVGASAHLHGGQTTMLVRDRKRG